MDFTKQQIEGYKRKHGDIYLVTVEDKSCILKRPGRKEMKAAQMAAASGPIDFAEKIINLCWVDGDAEIKQDDKLFMAVQAKVDKIIETGEAEVKKL